MVEMIYFDCLRYSYKLIEKSCHCMLLVGTRKAVANRRKALIDAGMSPSNLIIVKTSKEQKEEYHRSKNSTVFMTLENWS